MPCSQARPGHIEHAAGHGRREQRTIQVITAVHPALPFPHACQVARIVRHRRHGPTGRARTQVEFIITDLTPAQADPAQLATLVRGHRAIENRLHWYVTFAEDHYAVRTGHAPTVMACLHNTAIGILHLAGWDNIAATTRHHARSPDRAITSALNC